MNFKKLGVAAAVSLALGVGMMGASNEARADAYSIGLIDITNFRFLDGGQTMDLSAFVPGTLTFLDTLSNTAQINGGAPVVTGGSTFTFTNVDPLQVCLGGGACPGQNVFLPTDPPPPNTTFVRSDSILAGAPFTGTPLTTGVHAGTVAESTFDTNGFGGSASDILLTSSFQFQLAQPINDIGIAFDALAFLQAWTAAGTTPPSSAGSDIKWEFILRDAAGNILIDWLPGGGTTTGLNILSSPCDLNQAASAGPSQPLAPVNLGAGPGICSGSFLATSSVALAANTTYSVTIAQHVTSQAIQFALPEPSSLLLLGLGILGLGFVPRFRRVA